LVFVLGLPLVAICATPRSETDVKLIYYLEKMMGEQLTQLNNSIANIDKQIEIKFRYLAEALVASDKVLDQKFVRVDKFMEKTSGYDSSLAALCNRMTILETESKVTAQVATAEMTKMVIWLGLFFTVIQIALNIMSRKDKEKLRTREVITRSLNGAHPLEPR